METIMENCQERRTVRKVLTRENRNREKRVSVPHFSPQILELQTECILDRIMYIEGTGFYKFKECHKIESLRNHTATAHKEREQLGDRKNVGESSCNSGDGTGQMAQPLMFMMMMIMKF
jgi:hypothetical protein